jgi:DNA polymerase-3 subunit delta'
MIFIESKVLEASNMQFKDMIGQERLIHYLEVSIINQTIGHAYIFEGPEGIGKRRAAIAFAKGIQCRNYQGDACNTCSSCLKINSGNHPDVRVIEPDNTTIKNKQIEELQQDLLRKPYESGKKIYIIHQADCMTISAQNRLLKTLEEPPEYGIILLMSTNANRFLPTIRSRCQILKFNRVEEQKIEKFIKNNYHVAEDEAKMLAGLSDGLIGKAVKMQESEDFKVQREEVIQIIEKVLNENELNVFDSVKFFQIYKENIDELLDWMILWFRDMLILQETGSEKFLINSDKSVTLQRQFNRIGYEKITNSIKIIEKTKKNIKANVNFQLAIEIMLLSMQEGIR